MLFSITAVLAQNLTVANGNTVEITTNTTYTGTMDISGILIVRSGATLTIGTTGSTATSNLNNGCQVLVESGATLIVYGSVTNKNNSNDIQIDGDLVVYGSLTNGNGSAIIGSGTLTSTGTVTNFQNGQTGTVFGSSESCNTGPCASSANTCSGFTNTISGTSSYCSSPASGTLTGSVVAGSPDYAWQMLGSSGGWVTATGTANASDYSFSGLTEPKQFRRKVTLNGSSCYSNTFTVSITTSSLTASVAINYATKVCNGADLTLVANPTNGGSNPTYIWYKNGLADANQVGTGSSYVIPSATVIANPFDDYYVKMTSDHPCVSVKTVTSTATSNLTVVTTTTTSGSPTITTDVSIASGICSGTSVTFTGTASAYSQYVPTSYQWSLNSGSSASSGSFSSSPYTTTYSNSTLTNGTIVKFYVLFEKNASQIECNSASVTVAVKTLASGSISSTSVCSGSSAVLGPGTLPSGTDVIQGYQWQIYNGTTYDNVSSGSGGTTNTYTTPALTANTRYRRGVYGTVCSNIIYTSSALVSVANTVSPGSIGSDQTICSGNSASLTSSVAASGTGNTLTYTWQSSADNNTYGDISGASSATYTSGALSSSTYFRRKVVGSVCTSPVYTNYVLVSVASQPSGGTIGSNQTICSGSTASLTNSATATGTGNTLTYIWQSSSDNNTYSDISGTNNAIYTTPALSSSTYYRRKVSGNICTTPAYSNFVLVTVASPLAGGTIGSDQSICSGSTASFTSSAAASGAGNTINYTWQSSADNSSYNDISGTNNSTYSSGALTGSTYFRRKATGSVCVTPAYSNFVLVTVASPLAGGTIGSDQSVCSGSTASLTNSVAATGSGNTLTYTWQSSSDNITYSDISGTNSAAYTTGSLTSLTYFRRKVNGNICTSSAYSNYVQISVASPVSGGTIGSNHSICSGNSTSLTNTVAGSGAGNTLTYTWQSSSDNSTFNDISGTNSSAYTTNPITSSTYFRRKLTGSICATAAYSNVVYVFVTGPLSAGGIGSNQTICSGSTAALTSTSPASASNNSLTYTWQSSTDNTTFTDISGTNSTTYSTAALTSPTYFRRKVTGNFCTTAVYTNHVLVNVASPVTAGNIDADQTICSGSSASLTSSADAAGSGNTITYTWQSSTDNITFNNISGSNNSAYSTGSLTLSTYFRRSATGNICSSPVYSDTVLVSVSGPLSAGLIGSDQAVCVGGTAYFTSSSPATGDPVITYTWESSADNVTFTAIPAANGETYNSAISAESYFRRKASGSICSTPVTSNAVHVTYNGSNNIWKGTFDNNWHNPANWCGSVPDETQDVVIDDVVNDPKIMSNAGVKSITVNSGAIVNLSGANELDVNGNWINNGGALLFTTGTVRFSGNTQTITGATNFGNLTIEPSNSVSISSGLTNVGGTLLVNSGVLNTNGNLVVDFTTGGNISADGTGNISGNVTYARSITRGGWHYISSPRGASSLSEFSDDYSWAYNGAVSYYYYDQSLVTTDMQKGWKSIRTAGYSSPATKGIAVWLQTPVVYDFTGTYNHSASYSTSALSYNSAGDPGQVGWHLIGNPFPSAIDWNSSGITKTNINNAIQFWDPATSMNRVYSFPDRINEASSLIAPMQSVFIQAKPGGGSIAFGNTSRSSGSSSFYRLASSNKIQLKVAGMGVSDETIIRFYDEASNFFDYDFDAMKMLNGGNNANIYSSIGGLDYAINSIKPVTSETQVSLKLKTKLAGKYSIAAEDFLTDPLLSVYLQDNLTGDLIDLRNQKVYEFTSGPSDNADRFELVFSLPQITSFNEAGNKPAIRVLPDVNGAVVEFVNNIQNTADINVYDFTGKQVGHFSRQEISGGRVYIPVNEGGYIFRVVVDNQSLSEKVIILGGN
jgi:hypothetical protein